MKIVFVVPFGGGGKKVTGMEYDESFWVADVLCFLIWILLCEDSFSCTLRIYALICALYFNKIFILRKQNMGKCM